MVAGGLGGIVVLGLVDALALAGVSATAVALARGVGSSGGGELHNKLRALPLRREMHYATVGNIGGGCVSFDVSNGGVSLLV